jgi:hypothetical protein
MFGMWVFGFRPDILTSSGLLPASLLQEGQQKCLIIRDEAFVF